MVNLVIHLPFLISKRKKLLLPIILCNCLKKHVHYGVNYLDGKRKNLESHKKYLASIYQLMSLHSTVVHFISLHEVDRV